MNRVYTYLLLGAITGSAWAESQTGLAYAVKNALEHDASLQAIAAEMDAASASYKEARANRWPAISARSQLTRSNQPVFVFGSLLEEGRFGANNFAIDSLNDPGELTHLKSALDLSLPLFTGYRNHHQIRLGELNKEHQQNRFEQQAQDIRFQAAILYLRLLLHRDLIHHIDQRLAASDNQIADARRLRAKGLVLGSDFFAAEAVRGNLKAWRIETATSQESLAARLEILTGKNDWKPIETFREIQDVVASEQALLQTALAKRPALKAAAVNTNMAEENRRQAGRSVLPELKAFASLETNTHDFSRNPTTHGLGLSASVPFGDPAYLARRSASAALERAAQKNQEAVTDQIRTDIAQAYAAFQGARSTVEARRETVHQAEESLRLFRPLYRSGRQSILDVLRAEETLGRAQAAYLESIYRTHAAYLDLMMASGDMTDAVIVDLDEHLKAVR